VIGSAPRRRVVTFVGPHQVAIEKAPLPACGEDDVRLEVSAVGLCTPEMRLWRGTRTSYPWRGGHEVAGTVVAGPDRIVGHQVAVTLAPRCGSCSLCRRGLDNHCAYSTETRDRDLGPGGLADSLVTAIGNLEVLPAPVPGRIAALTEPLACVLHSIGRSALTAGDEAVVLGEGTMSSLHVFALRRAGVQTVRVFDPRRTIGPSVATIAADEEINLDEARAGRVSVDGAFIIGVDQDTVAGALVAVRRAGVVVTYGSPSSPGPIGVDLEAIRRSELDLRGSVSHTRRDFAAAAELVVDGVAELAALCGASFSLAATPEALEHAVANPGRRTHVLPPLDHRPEE